MSSPPVAAMAEVFERAVARGEIDSAPNPRVVVSTISGAIQQISLLGLLGRDELINHALAMVLDGLVEPAQPTDPANRATPRTVVS